jgi:hypothetical protein
VKPEDIRTTVEHWPAARANGWDLEKWAVSAAIGTYVYESEHQNAEGWVPMTEAAEVEILRRAEVLRRLLISMDGGGSLWAPPA